MERSLFDDLEKANPKLLSRLPTGTTNKSKPTRSAKSVKNEGLPHIKQKPTTLKRDSHFLDSTQQPSRRPIVEEPSDNLEFNIDSSQNFVGNMDISTESTNLKTEIIELNKRALLAFKAGLLKDCEYHLKTSERLILKQIVAAGDTRQTSTASLLNLTIFNMAFFNLK